MEAANKINATVVDRANAIHSANRINPAIPGENLTVDRTDITVDRTDISADQTQL